MTIDPVLAATGMLASFVALSFYDGVIVHFFVERLPFRPAARLEHRLHTGRAILFPAILLTFFGANGPTVAGWALLAVDQALEIWDMAVERRSREHTGGLRSGEYVVHGLLTTLRAAAVTFTAVIDRLHVDTAALDRLASLLFPGSIVVAVVHVVLASPLGRSGFALRRPTS